MSCYRTCPLCGAALDPGERCDCQRYERIRPYTTETTEGSPENTGQFPENTGKFPKGATGNGKKEICKAESGHV